MFPFLDPYLSQTPHSVSIYFNLNLTEFLKWNYMSPYLEWFPLLLAGICLREITSLAKCQKQSDLGLLCLLKHSFFKGSGPLYIQK